MLTFLHQDQTTELLIIYIIIFILKSVLIYFFPLLLLPLLLLPLHILHLP